MCYILEIKEMFGMDSNKTPSEIIAELCVEAGISKSELARRLEIKTITNHTKIKRRADYMTYLLS